MDRNPFEITKATDFTDRQIRDYWVDLIGKGELETLLSPKSPAPLFVLGSKGSGKTHLLRYCSYKVRRLGWDIDPRSGVNRDGYIGIYVQADGLNASRFSGRGIVPDVWKTLFPYAFELWTMQLVLDVVLDLLGTSGDLRRESQAVDEVCALFDRPPALSGRTLQALKTFLIAETKQLDFAVSNAVFAKALQFQVLFTPGRLMMASPDIFVDLLGLDADTKFLYLIDELENFTADQQRFINSLVRYRKGRVSLRIGARLYGLRTRKTENGDEENKQGSEYDELRLDARIRESSHYRDYAKALCARRLVESNVFPHMTDSAALAGSLDGYFETPKQDFLEDTESQRITAKYLAGERPHLGKLRKQLKQFSPSGRAEEIVSNLTCPEHPLLEKNNILLLYRAWFQKKDLEEASREIRGQMREFLHNGVKDRYHQSLAHFKSDLMAQLYRECKVDQVYAGLDTFIEMSKGVPRNLLGLLKHIYSRAVFNGEEPFKVGKVSLQSQRDGVRDAALWFLEDAQPDQYGNDVRLAIDSLTELFREIRFADKPVECAVSAFSASPHEWTEKAQEVLKHAENWAFLLKVHDGAKDKNSKAITDKYQLNPILAPRKDLSVTRRGTFTLDKMLGESIFDPDRRFGFDKLLRERTESMNAPFRHTSLDADRQLELGSDD